MLRRNLIYTGKRQEHYSITLLHKSITLQYSLDLLKVPMFPYHKKFHNKGHVSLETDVLKNCGLTTIAGKINGTK